MNSTAIFLLRIKLKKNSKLIELTYDFSLPLYLSAFDKFVTFIKILRIKNKLSCSVELKYNLFPINPGIVESSLAPSLEELGVFLFLFENVTFPHTSLFIVSIEDCSNKFQLF